MSESAQNAGMPRIGDPAPDFSAVTTHGPISLGKWQDGKWVILFSHPADFTPVCTTELTEFARRESEFTALNTKLIGLSVDSVHSHLAWIQNMREKLGVLLPYPMIADLDTRVSQAYGMLHPNESATMTVRALFIIDPARRIRALVYYPLNVGRNVDEIVRLLTALQTSDQHSVACPVGWQPGQKVIVPPPKTMAEVEERLASDHEKVDFYLMRKSV